MKESTLSKITASVAVAKGMAQRALAANPNPQWTEYEMQSIDEWIARQDVKLDRPEAIRHLVELGLKVKTKISNRSDPRSKRSRTRPIEGPLIRWCRGRRYRRAKPSQNSR